MPDLRSGSMKDSHPRLRKLQAELCATVIARILDGFRITVAWICAGSGKTFAYLHTAQELFCRGMIDGVIVLCPRLNLRSQAELDWNEWRPHYYLPVMGKIVGSPNISPLTRADEFGYITTYASLNAAPAVHLQWAKEHKGRFLLVLDEGQYLGYDPEDPQQGTLAADRAQQLSELALHTILLTGTPDRSDGNALILATYSDKKDAEGIYPLQWDVRATYREGIAQGYLRPAQFNLSTGWVKFSNGEETEFTKLEKGLRKALWHEAIWQELVELTVQGLQQMRKHISHGSQYKALIACLDQDHARKVHQYLTVKYPQFKSKLAVSDDGREAHQTLQHFRLRENYGDILVTKEMVSIGYDCPSITVVGNLSSTRWNGWLQQLFFRGGRIWKARSRDEQVCIYVSTDDRWNQKFAEAMREEMTAGLKDRDKKPPPPPGDEYSVIDGALTGEIAIGLSPAQDLLDPAQLAGVRDLQSRLTYELAEVRVAELLRAGGYAIPTAPAEYQASDRTWEQKRQQYGKQCHNALNSFIFAAHGINPGQDAEAFREKAKEYQATLNRLQGVPNVEHLTEEQWKERIRIIDSWRVKIQEN